MKIDPYNHEQRYKNWKEKRSSFGYRLMFCRTYDELMYTIKKLKNEPVMPLLLWMYKENIINLKI